MEKLSRRKGRCETKGLSMETVLLENVPVFVLEENIREVFSNYEVEVNSVKFWILPNRKLNQFRRFAEVEVFSEMAAAEMVDNLDSTMEFGVKLRVRQK